METRVRQGLEHMFLTPPPTRPRPPPDHAPPAASVYKSLSRSETESTRSSRPTPSVIVLSHLPELSLRSEKMAAIPSSGSLIATHDFYRRRVGSTSSNSSCGSIEHTGEVVPHHPGLPRQDSGHWWTSFFFSKHNQPGAPGGSDRNGSYTVANGQVTCIAREMALHRQVSETSESDKTESAAPSAPSAPSS